jgi:hypothetical protein
MTSNIPIEPYTNVTTTVATSFSVSCRSLNLFENASFTVDTFDVTGRLLNRQVVPITNEQYLAWNNNDEYIVQLMAQILGFTIITSDGTQATVESSP